MKAVLITATGPQCDSFDIAVLPPEGVYMRRRLCHGWYLLTMTNPPLDERWINVVARDLLKLYCGVGPVAIVRGPAWIVPFEQDRQVDCTDDNVDMWTYVIELLMQE